MFLANSQEFNPLSVCRSNVTLFVMQQQQELGILVVGCEGSFGKHPMPYGHVSLQHPFPYNQPSPPLPLLFIRWRDGNWFYLSRRGQSNVDMWAEWNSNSGGIDQQSIVSICWWIERGLLVGPTAKKRELEGGKRSRYSQFPHELLQRERRRVFSTNFPTFSTREKIDQHPMWRGESTCRICLKDDRL